MSSIEKLRPYENFVITLEKTLLFHYPIAFVSLMIFTVSYFYFIIISDCGVIASLGLLSAMLYSAAVVWNYAKKILEPFLFRTNKIETRIRSFEEICDFFDAIFRKLRISRFRVTISLIILVLIGYLFRNIRAVYVVFALTVILLITPGILLHPTVYNMLPIKNKEEDINNLAKRDVDIVSNNQQQKKDNEIIERDGNIENDSMTESKCDNEQKAVEKVDDVHEKNPFNEESAISNDDYKLLSD